MGWTLGEDGKPKRNSTIENRQWIDFDPSWVIENLPEGRFFEGVDKLGISVLQDLYDYKRNHVTCSWILRFYLAQKVMRITK